MDRIAELKQRRARLLAEMRTIHDATITKRKGVDGATEDQHRRMNDEERGKYEAAKMSYEMVGIEIEFEEREREVRHQELKRRLGDQARQPNHGPFACLGEQLLAVAQAARGRVDPRLEEVQTQALTEQRRFLSALPPDEARALGASVGVDADGGYLIQPDYQQELLQRTYSIGQVLPRTRQIGIGANSNGIVMHAFDDADLSGGAVL